MLASGDRLGDFVIERMIGRGAFSEVYLAAHQFLDSQVAIKVLTSPDQRNSLMHEAKVLSRMGHDPHFAELRGTQFSEDPAWIATNYYPWPTLRACLGAGRISFAKACRIIDAVLAAAIRAHASGFVHGDIKPENILVGSEQQQPMAVLIDFGFSQEIPPERGDRPSSLIPSTRLDGESVSRGGTPAYMSPEQAAGEVVDGRSDLFSIAVVFFEALTGQLPQPGDRFEHFPEVGLNAEQAAAAGRFFDLAWCRRERRFSSAREMRQELRTLAEGLLPKASSSSESRRYSVVQKVETLRRFCKDNPSQDLPPELAQDQPFRELERPSAAAAALAAAPVASPSSSMTTPAAPAAKPASKGVRTSTLLGVLAILIGISLGDGLIYDAMQKKVAHAAEKERRTARAPGHSVPTAGRTRAPCPRDPDAAPAKAPHPRPFPSHEDQVRQLEDQVRQLLEDWEGTPPPRSEHDPFAPFEEPPPPPASNRSWH